MIYRCGTWEVHTAERAQPTDCAHPDQSFERGTVVSGRHIAWKAAARKLASVRRKLAPGWVAWIAPGGGR